MNKKRDDIDIEVDFTQLDNLIERWKARKASTSDLYSNLIYSNREWGSWYSLFKDDNVQIKYQVKKICVNIGAKLSLQSHNHRSEHWVVLSGTAKVTCDSTIFTLFAGQSTFIPMGSIHRLENVGKIPLEIIEIQQGLYIEEDDITRYEDDFGRC